MRRTLICGVCGQDGAHLARHLLAKGHEVRGTSRDASARSLSGLISPGIANRVKLLAVERPLESAAYIRCSVL